MTDADVDGEHIRTLLLTFFFRHMPEVIQGGHLYIAQPPLYLIPQGRKKYYAYSEEERDATLVRLAEERKARGKGKAAEAEEAETEEVLEAAEAPEEAEASADVEPVELDSEQATMRKAAGVGNIQRYKGLGEINAEQLWETTMDPDKRILLQVNIEDAEKADAIFNKLMGDEVPLRKSFIQTHAKSVGQNLDI